MHLLQVLFRPPHSIIPWMYEENKIHNIATMFQKQSLLPAWLCWSGSFSFLFNRESALGVLFRKLAECTMLFLCLLLPVGVICIVQFVVAFVKNKPWSQISKQPCLAWLHSAWHLKRQTILFYIFRYIWRNIYLKCWYELITLTWIMFSYSVFCPCQFFHNPFKNWWYWACHA